LIIANPAAGRSRSSRRFFAKVVAALERRGCAVVVRRSGPRPGDLERLAREAEADFEAIVAAGGDGTVNAVANGLAGSARPMGLLPLGTANVLAREIGLPRRAEALAGLIAVAPATAIWPGSVDGRLFLMMASCGFDSETVASVDPGLKRHVGRLAFLWAVLVRLRQYRGRELLIRADGVEYRAAAMIAAKGRRYAGTFIVAPQADLAEPVLDLLLLRQPGRAAILRHLAALPLGLSSRLRGVTTLRVRSVRVAGDESLPVQADGEIVGRLPVAIGIAEQPLWLIRPCPSARYNQAVNAVGARLGPRI
jgi:diacylglycerol kinase (ATP)